jgi:hypothetical protein
MNAAAISQSIEEKRTPSNSGGIAAPLPEGRIRKPSKYKNNPKRGPVNVVRFIEDGVELVNVPLFGRGFGYSVVLDAADWDHGRANEGWPECWILSGGGAGYVVSSRKTVSGLAQQPRSRTPLAAMNRLIMDAQPGEVVKFLDGNPRNLRRSNLRKLDTEAAKKWRSEATAKRRAEQRGDLSKSP